jgi:class 3 adenylate cyclase
MPEDPRKLRALLDLNAMVDDLVEESLQERRSLAETMKAVLPKLCEFTGASAAMVRSFSEDLKLTSYRYPADPFPKEEEILARTTDEKRETPVIETEDAIIVAQPLDVAGEWFGCAALVAPRSSEAASDPSHLAESLNVTCEELDNFLHAIRAAREKHRVMMELGDSLRHRVLAEGLSGAVRVLCRAVSMGRLLLVCVAEENDVANLHVEVFEGDQLTTDTMGRMALPDDVDTIRAEARRYLVSNDTALLHRFGFEQAQEEVLINGVTQETVVGKMVVTSRHQSFNTYDRELLSGFAGFIRQRVVDFNKEWRTLARSFRPQDVSELLQYADYAQRWLSPAEQEVGIVYVDIAGFTRLSEQVLQTPSAVAQLVETWSREAVQIVWDHGGVFDKMVGDCIIALFGPPFYKDAPADRALRATRCALAIREMTAHIPERDGFEKIRNAGGLAITGGVNLAPLFVGLFGSNDNFTGFSSGMNNTARLQGCGERGEILVMSDTIARLRQGHGLSFGEERSAKVKNVAEPIRFRPVK